MSTESTNLPYAVFYILDSRARSVDLPLDATCELWQAAKLNPIVMDVSQIKNVAFSLGELPSNVIRLNYYYLRM